MHHNAVRMAQVLPMISLEENGKGSGDHEDRRPNHSGMLIGRNNLAGADAHSRRRASAVRDGDGVDHRPRNGGEAVSSLGRESAQAS